MFCQECQDCHVKLLPHCRGDHTDVLISLVYVCISYFDITHAFETVGSVTQAVLLYGYTICTTWCCPTIELHHILLSAVLSAPRDVVQLFYLHHILLCGCTICTTCYYLQHMMYPDCTTKWHAVVCCSNCTWHHMLLSRCTHCTTCCCQNSTICTTCYCQNCGICTTCCCLTVLSAPHGFVQTVLSVPYFVVWL